MRSAGCPGGTALGRFRTYLVPSLEEDRKRQEEERFTRTPDEKDAEFIARLIWEAREAEKKREDGLEGMVVEHPPLPEQLLGFGFAEVYWAHIPRGPAQDCYVLDESKRWAKSVVERVRMLDEKNKKNAHRADYWLAEMIIEEMIEGTELLERILFLAEKTSVGFQFDLQKVLTNYLGDVQVMTEFENLRNEIIGTFQGMLAGIVEQHPDAEIYVIPHSEGSVVALLGLMRGLCGWDGSKPPKEPAPAKPWALRVRGLMTMGSPITKHLLLWEELWKGLKAEEPKAAVEKIRWINYFDYADPVGYKVKRAWDKLCENNFLHYFDFQPDRDDIGFSRYLLPGHAHNAYWDDREVFGHFFEEVVWPEPQNKVAPEPAGGINPVPSAPVKPGATGRKSSGNPKHDVEPR